MIVDQNIQGILWVLTLPRLRLLLSKLHDRDDRTFEDINTLFPMPTTSGIINEEQIT